ncbi:MAG: MATE family efflux transporter [Burkholderiales bacterium]
MSLTIRRPRLLHITWPSFAELVLGFGVGLLGLWLAARTSDNAAAAFALSNHLLGAFVLLFRIISMGVSVVITQNLGAGNRFDADRTARAALGATSWMAVFTAVMVFFGAERFLSGLSAPAPVLQLAKPYLQMLALALALDAYNATFASVMRAHLRTRDTMLNILAMHSLHLLLSFPLMQSMGLMGFAVAMALSRAFGLAWHILLWRWRLDLIPHAHDWWALHRKILAPVFHIGLPGAAENMAYRMAFLVSVTVVAGLGATQLATHSYTLQITNLIVLFTAAIGFGCEILIGHLIGAGQLHDANRLLRKCLLWGLSVSCCIALIAAMTAPWTMHLFTHHAQIIASATTLLWLNVILEPGRTCNIVIIDALRATGDARFPVIAGAASMLLILAGGSWLLGVHFKLGLVGVWIAYAADEWVRGVIMATRWLRFGWLSSAKKTRRRVMQQREIISVP